MAAITIDSTTNRILSELAESLLELYKDKLKAVILYGSVARGTQTEESDIDILILIDEDDKNLRKYEEGLSEVSTNYALKYLKVFSIIDISYNEYVKWKNSLPFYKNVSDEGVVLYAA